MCVCIHCCYTCLPLWSQVCTVQSSSQQNALMRQRHTKVHFKELAEAVRLHSRVGDAYHMLTCKERQGNATDIAMSMFRLHGIEGRR